MDWRIHLDARLRALKPATVCALDDAARTFATRSLPDTPMLALGLAALDGLDADAAGQLIHRVRLYAAPRILLVARSDCALDDNAFRALGFVLDGVDTNAGIRIQSYDLDTYKPVPDWLNARFWAHPERWEP
ncbi:MAG: DUF6231 family protein [Thiobacillus sp.]|nr:DUF6231 family protein [Thiobacillus sp.]